MCGYNFVTASAADAPPAIAPSNDVSLSVGSGFRFGLGFMSAVVVFWLIISLVILGFFGALVGALFSGLPR
jgi:hypothetical protein